MLRSVMRTIVAGSIAAAISACGGSSDSTTGPPPAGVFTTVAVTPSSPTVNVGSTTTLTAVAKDQNGATFPGASAATWSSSDVSKATVDPVSGVVTGVANGSATITASITSGSVTHTGSQQISVVTLSASSFVTATSSLSFDPHSVTIGRASGTGTVTWTFQSVGHTVSWDSQPSGAAVADIGVSSSTNVARNFTVAGTYTYHCSIHSNMSGVVVVQ
jgi:plastocyanin